MDAIGVEDRDRVVHHPTLEIMDLLPNDCQGRTYLVATECVTVTDIPDSCPDDVAFRLTYTGGLHDLLNGERVGGQITQRVGMGDFHPFDIVVLMLVKRIDNGDQLTGHLGFVTSVSRQHIIPAVEVGRQFDHARSLPFLKANHDACRHTVRITQFRVGYHGISRDADFHRLTCKIPGAVCLYIYSKGALGKHHCNYH